MAISAREKKLVGIMLIIGAVVGGGGFLVLPEFDSLMMGFESKTQLEQKIESQTRELAALQSNLSIIQKGKSLPADLKIREFSPETQDKEIKEMLTQLITFATQAGNTLISLEPSKEENVILPAEGIPPPATNPDVSQALNAADGGDPNAEDGEQLPAPPPPQLHEFQYVLAIRGNFGTIRQFIERMNSYNELVEIAAMEMKNEVNPDRSFDSSSLGGPGSSGEKHHYDPAKPIRLSTTLKLYLVPQNPVSAPPALPEPEPQY